MTCISSTVFSIAIVVHLEKSSVTAKRGCVLIPHIRTSRVCLRSRRSDRYCHFPYCLHPMRVEYCLHPMRVFPHSVAVAADALERSTRPVVVSQLWASLSSCGARGVIPVGGGDHWAPWWGARCAGVVPNFNRTCLDPFIFATLTTFTIITQGAVKHSCRG